MEEDLNIIRKELAKIFTSESYEVPVRHVDDTFKAPPIITPRDFGVAASEKATPATGIAETTATRKQVSGQSSTRGTSLNLPLQEMPSERT